MVWGLAVPAMLLLAAARSVTSPPQDPAVGLCPGPYGGPGGWAFSHERGTPEGFGCTRNVVVGRREERDLPERPPRRNRDGLELVLVQDQPPDSGFRVRFFCLGSLVELFFFGLGCRVKGRRFGV